MLFMEVLCLVLSGSLREGRHVTFCISCLYGSLSTVSGGTALVLSNGESASPTPHMLIIFLKTVLSDTHLAYCLCSTLPEQREKEAIPGVQESGGGRGHCPL